MIYYSPWGSFYPAAFKFLVRWILEGFNEEGRKFEDSNQEAKYSKIWIKRGEERRFEVTVSIDKVEREILKYSKESKVYANKAAGAGRGAIPRAG